jgi:UDP-N-acetylglucosamine enolpyruvyl transferase
MSSFIIEGGHLLSGTICPQGAKNEALQVICATLLTAEEVTIRNIPDIRDVNNLIQLLKDIGVKVHQNNRNDYTFCADCYACVHACPKRAIRFVNFDEPNPDVRYRNPHVTLADLVKANNQL